MNVRYPTGVLHSFSIKNIFYDKMNLKLLYFRVTKWENAYCNQWTMIHQKTHYFNHMKRKESIKEDYSLLY